MEQAEVRSALSPQSDHPTASGSSHPADVAILVCRAESKGPSSSPDDGMDGDTQVWDHPWIDLGGEG